MKFLLIISLFLSTFSLFLFHPMSLGLILLLQTIMMSIISGMMNSFWFSYILFLIMIGGMLILFIYMTSIASNEKFKYSNKLTIMFMTMNLMLISSIILDNYFINMLNSEMINFIKINSSFTMNKFINLPSSIIFYLLIIYLLITMIAVVKICLTNKGPLRQT
uniref:NADH-ubiquinone oxidoreductase chain 6 n=1 Tax=Chaetosoma scaritides TaxID=546502 RepID=B6D8W7_9CUCU|nr:NADH dehydrogenase subunit 6 [Chaetosoma scaritides]ACF35105.1 NADH dehydrogenase subunit 6 [Chaetosoma scaritides]